MSKLLPSVDKSVLDKVSWLSNLGWKKGKVLEVLTSEDLGRIPEPVLKAGSPGGLNSGNTRIDYVLHGRYTYVRYSHSGRELDGLKKFGEQSYLVIVKVEIN